MLALIAHNSADMFGIGLAIRDRSSTTTKQTFVVVLSLIFGTIYPQSSSRSAWPTTADRLVRWVLSVDLKLRFDLQIGADAPDVIEAFQGVQQFQATPGSIGIAN